MARFDSGSPRADAESDFIRARRQQVLSNVARRMRGHGEDSAQSLPFQEVIDALGIVSEQPLGVQVIPVKNIVGSVDKVRDFDPKFRPTSGRSRQRWERLAQAMRTGQSFPPIDVYQVGDMYFVRDGHHRVSVCRALDIPVIDADVTKVVTLTEPTDVRSRADLTAKELRRAMLQRVPLRKSRRADVTLTNAESYPFLAEMVEAWAARTMFEEHEVMDRATAAARWYEEEYVPVLDLIESHGLRQNDETDADAYMRIARDRYHTFFTHLWNDEIAEALRDKQVRKLHLDMLNGNVMDMLNTDVRKLIHPPGSTSKPKAEPPTPAE